MIVHAAVGTTGHP